MTLYGYFPGCSLHGSGRELDASIRALATRAGIDLREVDDWNCCGATAAHSLNHNLALALPYRVLALAEAQGLQTILAPCAACFSRLKGTIVRLSRRPDLVPRMQEITGLQYHGPTRILNIVEFIDRLLADGLKGRLTSPLKGLRVAPYYGCLLSRGDDIITSDDHENPVGMEAAIRASGAVPVPWNYATECCGGGFSMSDTGAVVDLSGQILAEAEAAGAEAIVAGCPMCHSNLDMRQLTINQRTGTAHRLPVLYLSELVGLAAGLDPKVLGLNRHFIDAMGVLDRAPGMSPGVSANKG